jgi:hypothetical protein
MISAQTLRLSRGKIAVHFSGSCPSRLDLSSFAGKSVCRSAVAPHRAFGLAGLPNVREGRNWEIPNVVLGDSLISDVDRAVLTVHRQLGRQFHLLIDG